MNGTIGTGLSAFLLALTLLAVVAVAAVLLMPGPASSAPGVGSAYIAAPECPPGTPTPGSVRHAFDNISTGYAASDLHARFDSAVAFDCVVQNAPGCPLPSHTNVSVPQPGFDLDWATDCVDPGESVVVQYFSNPPATLQCNNWTRFGTPLNFDCDGQQTPLPTPTPPMPTPPPPTPTSTATNTPVPTATNTPVPTATTFPTATNTPVPTATATAPPGQPDLVVESITDAQDPLDCTSPVGVNVQVRNIGVGGAGPSTTRVSAANSGDSELVATPPFAFGGQAVTFYAPVAGLPIGDTYTAVADFLGTVQESNEGNNTASASFSQRSLPTCTPTPTPTATATPTPCDPEGCPTVTPTATATPTPTTGHDGKVKRIAADHNVRLSDGTADAEAVSVQVRNDGDHTEPFGIYVDIVPPGGITNPYGCIPIGRIVDAVVTLAPGEQTSLATTLTLNCTDVAGALGQTYTILAAIDVHVNDGGACAVFELQSVACFNALADDDDDDTDNRVVTNAFKVR